MKFAPAFEGMATTPFLSKREKKNIRHLAVFQSEVKLTQTWLSNENRYELSKNFRMPYHLQPLNLQRVFKKLTSKPSSQKANSASLFHVATRGEVVAGLLGGAVPTVTGFKGDLCPNSGRRNVS